jgi:cytoskeletal protein CcmA (bactofilin family)
MPASKQDKIPVACPHCGQSQPVPRTAISTVCKKCGQHFEVQAALRPAPKKVERAPEQRRIACFDCGAHLDVSPSAESTMCKRCSSYIDLKDYQITNAVSKNFKTKGRFVVEAKGYVFNTEATVGEAVIKGRFLGKLFAEHSLTVHSTAEIKGSFKTGCLIIPPETTFRWKETIKVGSAEIGGELANDLQADGTVTLRSTARLFGNVEARGLVVESGAVVVGLVSIKP